ncbi:MAG: hypothetical protein K2I05_03820 [Mailhella sp.]|nr:hypothetical protein [Mailhella sp.]
MKIFQTKTFLFCICFLSAWFAASITMDLREAPVHFSGIKQNSAVQNTGNTPKQYQKILQANLFHGLVYSPAKQQALRSQTAGEHTNDSSIPVSSLPLILTGTIILNDSSENKAVIGNGKEQKLYTVNQTVSDWKIVEINREEVIIAQNAKKEKLVLRKENAVLQADFTYPLSKNELTDFFSDIPSVLQHVQILPYNKDNIQGLQIISINPGTYFDKFRLLPQDVLLQADDTAIRSYSDIARLAEMIRNDTFTIILLRNNKKLVIQYSLT